MNKNNYIPQPIDTKGVVLPKELNALAEEIAKNVHEVWSKGRMKEGWTYGEKRDDARKRHPCLVPYENLTETEKEYDRNTSQETLKLILKLGFKIVKEWWNSTCRLSDYNLYDGSLIIDVTRDINSIKGDNWKMQGFVHIEQNLAFFVFGGDRLAGGISISPYKQQEL